MKENKIPVVPLFASVFIAYIITFAVLVVYAVLLTYTPLSEGSMGLVVMCTTVISVIAAGFYTAKKAVNRGWLWGMASGCIYSVVLILLSNVFAAGGAIFDVRSITLIILAVASGGLGGMIGINASKR